MKNGDNPPPHRGGEIVRGLPCVKRLQQGKINKVCNAKYTSAFTLINPPFLNCARSTGWIFCNAAAVIVRECGQHLPLRLHRPVHRRQQGPDPEDVWRAAGAADQDDCQGGQDIQAGAEVQERCPRGNIRGASGALE